MSSRGVEKIEPVDRHINARNGSHRLDDEYSSYQQSRRAEEVARFGERQAFAFRPALSKRSQRKAPVSPAIHAPRLGKPICVPGYPVDYPRAS